MAKWIKEEPEAYLEALVEDDPIEAVAVICRSHLGGVTFQRSAMIEGVMRDVLRCGAPWGQAAQTLSSHYDENWNSAAVKEQLDELVARRHRIAHSADLKENGAGTQPILRAYVVRATVVITAVGNAVQEVITTDFP